MTTIRAHSVIMIGAQRVSMIQAQPSTTATPLQLQLKLEMDQWDSHDTRTLGACHTTLSTITELS